MKTYIYNKKRYIALYLVFSIFFCALLVLFIYLGAYIYPKDTPLQASEPKDKEVTVIIDAGHGGEDCGAIGKNGIYEKDINLNIALCMYEILSANGVNSILTRNEDVLLYDKNSDYKGHKKEQDLLTRRRIAEQYENAIFISIHMNAFPEEKYSGLQVYFSKNHQASELIAKDIQELTKSILMPNNTRKAKAAGTNIYLLDRLNCPSVLVECGFLSNELECKKLSSEEYQKQMALCLSVSVMEYILENNSSMS